MPSTPGVDPHEHAISVVREPLEDSGTGVTRLPPWAWQLLVLALVTSCTTPPILTQHDPATRACGAHGVDCGRGLCCEDGNVCGPPTAKAPFGTCRYTGDE